MSGSLASKRPIRVLIVDDDQGFHSVIKLALKGRYEIRSAYHSDEATVLLKKGESDVILLDIQMRTPTEGFDAIPKLRELAPEAGIIMVSGMTDVWAFREALKNSVHDYVPKDFTPEHLAMSIESVLERKRLQRRDRQNRLELKGYQVPPKLVGSSASVDRLRRLLEKLRRSHANILITGESGTGKEVVARLLRGRDSEDRLEPFISIDSATIQSSTAESILFGHEKGAFTGADKMSRGLFEEADGGIIYFDEIGNMSLDIQAKLLRVIQEKEVLRLGSSRPIPLDFRVVAATNKNLEQMAADGLFKEDLLQRLSVLPVEIPPLRERKEDIPELVHHFISLLPTNNSQEAALELSEESLAMLQAYPWPGNIRELSNAIVYAHAMSLDGKVEPSDLPSRVREGSRGTHKGTQTKTGGKLSFQERLADFEKALLTEEYISHEGNVSRMAVTIGMDRSHLHHKLRGLGIHKPTDRKTQDLGE